ncbi:MAG: DUF2795 domain-containing protein [Armatimonadetes bacterium]|nr:MAG: DUF2795 domain-containing protein [Armatimonadota bacterium]
MDENEISQGGQGSVVNPIQVQKFLEGLDYPVNKQQLVDYAKKQGADENVMRTLNRIPDQSFETPVDVSEAIGKLE